MGDGWTKEETKESRSKRSEGEKTNYTTEASERHSRVDQGVREVFVGGPRRGRRFVKKNAMEKRKRRIYLRGVVCTELLLDSAKRQYGRDGNTHRLKESRGTKKGGTFTRGNSGENSTIFSFSKVMEIAEKKGLASSDYGKGGGGKKWAGGKKGTIREDLEKKSWVLTQKFSRSGRNENGLAGRRRMKGRSRTNLLGKGVFDEGGGRRCGPRKSFVSIQKRVG